MSESEDKYSAYRSFYSIVTTAEALFAGFTFAAITDRSISCADVSYLEHDIPCISFDSCAGIVRNLRAHKHWQARQGNVEEEALDTQVDQKPSIDVVTWVA